jgi:putative FmdB family regulatory protein
MPLYEYRCRTCSAEFEMFLSVGEADRVRAGYRKTCKTCGRARRLEQIPSRTGTPILKAGQSGGFYKPSRPDRTE